MNKNLWFSPSRVVTNKVEDIRLFVFHHAGGSASFCRKWDELLAPNIQIMPLQLPGREQRISEAPYRRFLALIDKLVEIVGDYLDKPFVFFGHSMGALLAYELINELVRLDKGRPFLFFTSGRQAPHIPDGLRPRRNLSDEDFCKRYLEDYSNPVVREVLQNAELRSLFLPQLRADTELMESYEFVRKAPLVCPIVAINGQDDKSATEENILPWREYSNIDFRKYYLEGDHFYINSSPEALLSIVRSEIDNWYDKLIR